MPQNKQHIWQSRRLTFLLATMDALALSLLWMGAWSLRAWASPWFGGPINPYSCYTNALPWMLIGWLSILAIYGHYEHRERLSSLNQLSRVFQASLWLVWIGVMISYVLLRHLELGRSIVLGAPFLFFIYLYGSRTLLRVAKMRALRRGEEGRSVLIVGVNPLGRRVAEHLAQHPEIGFRLAGFVATGAEKEVDTAEPFASAPVMGSLNNLKSLIESADIDEVFFADPTLPTDQVLNRVIECEPTGAAFKIVSDQFFHVLAGDAIIEAVDGIPVTRLGGGQMTPFQTLSKRILDLAGVALLAPFWIPTWGGIALAIWMEDGRPVLFKQKRVGLRGREFDFYKFRTMTPSANPYAVAPTDPCDPRITRLGRFLRKTSLDEIPQFLNILRGDMSLVGPRPEMKFIVDGYEEWQKARLDVKPGLTGLWQVVGRKNLPLEFNIEYDLWYIRNRSLVLDMMILIKTIPAVLFGKGAF